VAIFATHRVTRLDLAFTSWRWPFADARRQEIDAHFEACRIKTPQLWNGKILLARNPVFTEDCFSAQYFETDFASFLAWRDWGFPDATVFNGFGAGALRGCDSAFVLGEMASHTANAGKIYFPAGTPDLNDRKGDTVDIGGSVTREVEEETGLTPSHYRAAPYWECIAVGRLIALIRILDSDLTGDMLRNRIEVGLARQELPELAAMHVVRGRDDLSAAMPDYMTAFLEAQFD
jgi:8-oxo-dGTP pyrophosphatase MutT (NUDIX family)